MKTPIESKTAHANEALKNWKKRLVAAVGVLVIINT